MENRKFLKLQVGIVITISVVFLLTVSICNGGQWILFHDDEIKGYVIDIETNEPIEGVIVVGMWRLSQIGSEGFGGYAKIIVERTDKDGRFTLPSWTAFKPLTANSVLIDFAPEIVIYKPGYRLYFSHKIMREGYTNDISKTEKEKRMIKEEYNINPAKLFKIYTDEERLENYYDWGTKARFPDKHFSKKQSKIIFHSLEEELLKISNTNKRKKRLLESHKESGGRVC